MIASASADSYGRLWIFNVQDHLHVFQCLSLSFNESFNVFYRCEKFGPESLFESTQTQRQQNVQKMRLKNHIFSGHCHFANLSVARSQPIPPALKQAALSSQMGQSVTCQQYGFYHVLSAARHRAPLSHL